MNGKDKIEVSFAPNSSRNPRAQEEVMEQTAGGQHGTSFIDPEIKAYLTQNQETVVHEDWICEFVRWLNNFFNNDAV